MLDSSSSSGSHHAHTQEVSGRQFKGKQEGQAQAPGVCGQGREGGSPGATVIANVTPCLLDTKSPMGGLGLQPQMEAQPEGTAEDDMLVTASCSLKTATLAGGHSVPFSSPGHRGGN